MTPTSIRKPKDKPKIPRISRLAREACHLLATKQVKTITGAAERLNCRREHLSRMLQKPHVQDYLVREAKRRVSSAVLRAAEVKVELLEAQSEHVRSDVSSELLAIAGISAPKEGGSQVNINISPGYVVKLRHASGGQVVEGELAEPADGDSVQDE